MKKWLIVLLIVLGVLFFLFLLSLFISFIYYYDASFSEGFNGGIGKSLGEGLKRVFN